MIHQLLLGGIIIGVCVLFQALMFDLIIRRVGNLGRLFEAAHSLRKALVITAVVLSVICVLIVEIWLWALVYIWLGALEHLEPALYFSISSFTTVGFGDLVLTEQWRLLSTVESTCGFIVFGWSSAFIFEVVSLVYRKEGRDFKG